MLTDQSGGPRRRTVLLGMGALAWTAAATPAHAAPVGRLKVGVLLDLSGPTRLHGRRQLAGVEVAAERINRGARRPGVELAVRDTHGDPGQAVRGGQELISGIGVSAIVGTSSSGTYPAVLELTGQAGIPLVRPGNGATPLEAHAFLCGATTRQVVQTLVGDLYRTGQSRVAAIAGMDVGAEALISDLEYLLPRAGMTLTAVERYQAPVTDLIAPLRAAVASDPDVLMCWGVPPSSSIAARDAHLIGWTGGRYFGPSAGTPVFLDGAGPAAEGARIIGHWPLIANQAPHTLPNRPVMLDFVTEFERTRGPVGTYTCYGADALNLIHRAARHGHDPDRLRTSLERVSYQGITGTFRFSPGNHAGLHNRSLTVLTVHNGTWAPAT